MKNSRGKRDEVCTIKKLAILVKQILFPDLYVTLYNLIIYCLFQHDLLRLEDCSSKII